MLPRAKFVAGTGEAEQCTVRGLAHVYAAVMQMHTPVLHCTESRYLRVVVETFLGI